jgi:predicted secreted protein
MSNERITVFLMAAATAAAAMVATPAQAQDLDALMRQSVARMNHIVAEAQRTSDAMVRQRMQDPKVQSAYRSYLARMRASGLPAQDFPSYTADYIYTRGFSADGIRHAQAANAGMQAREHTAWQGVQQAQARRGAAQQAQRDGYSAHQQEAGRALLGQSTYTAPNGAPLQLPHTWQANTTHRFQGNTYGVDASGQYHVLGADGWWRPVQRR